MVQDFGPGMTVDELIGWTAEELNKLQLPTGDVYNLVIQSARYLVKKNFKFAVLMEIWGDGHTVWSINNKEQPLWVTPTGEIRRSMNGDSQN